MGDSYTAYCGGDGTYYIEKSNGELVFTAHAELGKPYFEFKIDELRNKGCFVNVEM